MLFLFNQMFEMVNVLVLECVFFGICITTFRERDNPNVVLKHFKVLDPFVESHIVSCKYTFHLSQSHIALIVEQVAALVVPFFPLGTVKFGKFHWSVCEIKIGHFVRVDVWNSVNCTASRILLIGLT